MVSKWSMGGMGGGADAVVLLPVMASSATVGGTLMGLLVMAGSVVVSIGREMLPPACSSVLWDVVLRLGDLLAAGSLLAGFGLMSGPVLV